MIWAIKRWNEEIVGGMAEATSEVKEIWRKGRSAWGKTSERQTERRTVGGKRRREAEEAERCVHAETYKYSNDDEARFEYRNWTKQDEARAYYSRLIEIRKKSIHKTWAK